ncbi:MAG: hypothetical protein K2X87_32600 [Gemmataceae bacterium]|nr:hypothetical protein [Gemmataceae bacterium]
MSAAGERDGQPRWVPSLGFFAVAVTTIAAGALLAAFLLFWWALGQLGPLGPVVEPPAGQNGWD